MNIYIYNLLKELQNSESDMKYYLNIFENKMVIIINKKLKNILIDF